jgi:hypothetical protein
MCRSEGRTTGVTHKTLRDACTPTSISFSFLRRLAHCTCCLVRNNMTLNATFWYVTPCSLLESYRHIGGKSSHPEDGSSALRHNGCKFLPGYTVFVGRDSVVGIATRYGLDGPEIEARWRRDFPHPPRPALRPTQPPVQWVPGLSWG